MAENLKALLALTAIVFMSIKAIDAVPPRNFSINFGNDSFVKDGKPFRYISGSIHYSRVPRYYWKDRLHKMFIGGLNAVQVYIPWNIHQPTKGVFDFTGQQDLVSFIQMAQEEELLVILRSGPFICGEWDFGGIPAWIIQENPKTVLRTMDPTYIKYVDIWYDKMLPLLKPLLYNNGGPIIMVQVENEYGSYFACDHNYTMHLRDKLNEHFDSNVVLFTTDGNGDSYVKCGMVPGVYITVDFGITDNPAASFKAQRDFQKNGPLVDSEFYTGWLDHWGQKHETRDKNAVTKSLDLILAYGGNINMYMYEGGTNFGYWNGANYKPFQPVPTSYDYDAPLTEAGDITDKYLMIRQVISKYHPLPDQPIPKSTPKAKYGKVQMKYVGTVQDLLEKLSPKGGVTSKYPLTMEAIGQYQGFALYRHTLRDNVPVGMLQVRGVRDRGYVMVNKKPQGVAVRESILTDYIVISGSKGQYLDILVENQGHINFGSEINNNLKGIIQNVTLNGVIVEDWTIYPILPDNYMHTAKNMDIKREPPLSKKGLMTPSIYVGQLTIAASAQDTYLDMTGWKKGQALIQGSVNLGRYWPEMGPQVRLYVPAPYLQGGSKVNTIIMMELEESPCVDADKCFIQFLDQPLINGTVTNIVLKTAEQVLNADLGWH